MTDYIQIRFLFVEIQNLYRSTNQENHHAHHSPPVRRPLLLYAVAMATAMSTAQEPNRPRLLTHSRNDDIAVGQKVKFSATLKDAAGNKTSARAQPGSPLRLIWPAWTNPARCHSSVRGDVLVGAIVNGKTVITHVMVKAGTITRVDVEPLKSALVVVHRRVLWPLLAARKVIHAATPG